MIVAGRIYIENWLKFAGRPDSTSTNYSTPGLYEVRDLTLGEISNPGFFNTNLVNYLFAHQV